MLVLRYYADLNVAETAEVLGTSVEAARSLTHRAIVGLRHLGHEFTTMETEEVSGAN